MSEDLTDEELAARRRQAAREKRRWLEAYEDEFCIRRIAELAGAEPPEELARPEQRGQDA
jgi:hypothetical protein